MPQIAGCKPRAPTWAKQTFGLHNVLADCTILRWVPPQRRIHSPFTQRNRRDICTRLLSTGAVYLITQWMHTRNGGYHRSREVNLHHQQSQKKCFRVKIRPKLGMITTLAAERKPLERFCPCRRPTAGPLPISLSECCSQVKVRWLVWPSSFTKK